MNTILRWRTQRMLAPDTGDGSGGSTGVDDASPSDKATEPTHDGATDEPETTGQKTTKAAAPPQEPSADDKSTPPWESEEFDSERAWNLIQRLRNVEREYNTIKNLLPEDLPSIASERKALERERDTLKAEMSDLQARVAELESSLDTTLKDEKDGLEEHILEILDEMPVEAQLAYIAKYRDKIKPVREAAPPTPPAGERPPVDMASDFISKNYSKQTQKSA